MKLFLVSHSISHPIFFSVIFFSDGVKWISEKKNAHIKMARKSAKTFTFIDDLTGSKNYGAFEGRFKEIYYL